MGGGFGIRIPHQTNEVFLMRMLWDLINRPDGLWCKVLYNKYVRDKYLQVYIKSQPYHSPLWKVLASIWESFWNHTVLQLGNGKHINFLLNKWMLDEHSFVSISIELFIDTTWTVKDVIMNARTCDINFINNHLPPNKVNQLIAISHIRKLMPRAPLNKGV